MRNTNPQAYRVVLVAFVTAAALFTASGTVAVAQSTGFEQISVVDFIGVEGAGWEAGAAITVAVDDPATEGVDASHDVTADSGSFWVHFGGTIDIQPGFIVSASSATHTESHTVRALSDLVPDPESDTVSGVAELGAHLISWVISSTAVYRDFTVTAADGSYTSPSFLIPASEGVGDGEFDLVAGTEGEVAWQDEFGNQTRRSWAVPNPTIEVDQFENRVLSNDVWPVGALVAISVSDLEGCEQTVEVVDRDWADPGFDVRFDDPACGIVTGHTVTAAHSSPEFGTISRSVEVTEVQVTHIDESSDVVMGYAALGSVVTVGAHSDDQNAWREVVAALPGPVAGVGVWTADFTAAGIDLALSGDGTIDIAPRVEGQAFQRDEDGDASIDYFAIPRITVVRDDGHIWGGGFQVGPIEITVDDPTTSGEGFEPDFVMVAEVGPGGFFDTETWIDPEAGVPFNIHQGFVVTVTDSGGTTESLVVTGIEILTIDHLTGIVTGISEPNAQIDVWPWHGDAMWVTADGSGFWTATFAEIPPYTGVGASESDDTSDGNLTEDDERALFFNARPGRDDMFGGEQWGVGEEVGITIDDPATAGLDVGPILKTVAALPEGRGAFFYLDIAGESGWDLLPGHVVEVASSSLGITKTLVVSILTVASDESNDLLEGTATPGAYVEVEGNSGEEWANRIVQADGSGYWVADFTTAGLTEALHGDHQIDIRPGSNGMVREFDADADVTWINWEVPEPPQFTVQRDSGDVWGGGFEPFELLTIGVDVNPLAGDGDEFTLDVTADDSGGFGTNVGESWTFEAGQVVSVGSKTLVLSNVVVPVVDPVTGEVAGTAEPGVGLQVWIHEESGEWHETIADELGDWSVTFSSLPPGTQGAAAVVDEDGDQTQVDWRILNPTVRVNAFEDFVTSNADWPIGVEVTVTVEDLAGCEGTGTVVQWGPWGSWFEVSFDAGSCDIQTGHTVTATHESVEHGLIEASVVVTALALTDVDEVTHTVTGTAEPGTSVHVNGGYDDQGGWRTVAVDGSGVWSATFTQAGLGLPDVIDGDGWFDLVPGAGGEASQPDTEGNETFLWWGVTNPQFTVQRDSGDVWGGGFEPFELLTIGVDVNPLAGDGDEFTLDVTADDSGGFGTNVGESWTFEAGQVVSVGSKTLVLSNVVVPVVDPVTGEVAGTAEPGVGLQVWIHEESGEWHETIADELGDWSVTFSSLPPGTQGAAAVVDEDGDQTQVDWRILNPTVRVNAFEDFVTSNADWPIGVEVTVTVEDLAGCEGTGTVVQWGPWGSWFEVSFDAGSCDIQTGHTVTATHESVEHGLIEASVVVTALALTDVDEVTHTVTGTAEPGTSVHVNGGYDDQGGWRTVAVDGSGVWSATFTQAGLGLPDVIDGDGWFDLVPGAGGEASQPDTQGNETFLWWGIDEPQVPTFGVHVQADFVSGGPEWAGPLVTVVAGGETYGVPVNSDGFYLDLTAAHDIVEGDLVTVSDGSYTKEHIVTGIEAHEPDATLDTVGGAASAGHGVYVWIHDSDVYRFVTDSLEWVADFTAAGIGQAEQGDGEFDLVPGTAGGAAEIDDDGDWTQVDWQVNFPPVAIDDFYDTDEDSELAGLEVLSNDEDDDGDPLGVDSFNVSGTVGDVALEGSIFEYGPGSWFDYLAPGESATDSWTYVASDGRGGLSQATVTITIDGVNDGPTMEDEMGPTVQHSDGIPPIVFTAADVDSDAVTFTVTGLPASLTTDESCASDGINGAVCTLTITGTATDALGDHTVTVLASDGDASAAANTTIRIVAEDADVLLHGGNPTAIPVAGGTTSGAFDLTFKVRHTDPDSGFEPTAGDLSLAAPAMVLEPVGPGPGVAGSCDDVGVSGTGYDTQVTVTCSFNSVPGNTYLVTAEVSGYFIGSANGVLVVYDPAGGEVEGGGTFFWDGDFTEFGFTMDYNKKGNNLKGSFLLIRHTVDGDFVVKSNVLYGMATGQDGGTSWATFAGKATMTVPSGDTFGNHEFVVGVTDNPDTFWIETRDKARVPVPALSMPRDSEGQPYLSVALLSGDVVVPNGNGGKKK